MISFSSIARLRMTQFGRGPCSASCLRIATAFCSWFVNPIKAAPAAGLVMQGQ